MLTHSHPLTIGTPDFQTVALADLALRDGAAMAWRQIAEAGNVAHAIDAVNGDFAFAVQNAAGDVVMAVDRFAIRTLCYRISDGQLSFAARADELADAATDIDPQAIFDYLYFHAIPSPRTIFKGVFRLPPGHYAVWANGNLLL